MSHAQSVSLQGWKKIALSALAAASVLASSEPAGANVSARGQNNRLRFSCSAGSIIENAAYSIAGVIDWRGDQGQATIAVLKQAYGRGGYYGYYSYGYSGYASAPTKAKDLKISVVLKDDGVNQVIRQKDGNAKNNLVITWRSDLPREVPREAYFIHGGMKFPLQNCRALVKRRQKNDDGDPTGRLEEESVDPEEE